MINKLLKSELDQLKKLISNQLDVNFPLSYADVISFLIKNYKQSRRIEVPIEEKLNVIIPLEKISALNVSNKLDGKQRISFSLES